jgi:hypothetical protein
VTFIFFALFPLTLALVPPVGLWLAFVVYGLRDQWWRGDDCLPPPGVGASAGVGLWGVRGFAICQRRWPVPYCGWLGPEDLGDRVPVGLPRRAVFYAFFVPSPLAARLTPCQIPG